MNAIEICERGLLPDPLTRWGMRRLIAQRLREERADGGERQQQLQRARIHHWRTGPIAVHTRRANEQHYELPPSFFEQVLGPRLKYSACYWPDHVHRLEEAEIEALEQICTRAGLADDMDILELGCGWGSLTCWMAQRYPNARIMAMSNSAVQREYLQRKLAAQGLHNVRLVTADINDFDPGARFDRIVSVEMFEHVRNHEQLLARVAQWLHGHGRLFVHIFCHRENAYPFETEGASNWMGRYFFTGGMMPSENLLLNFQNDVRLDEQWRLAGTHYQRTAEAWLENLDTRREPVLDILAASYGQDQARQWLQRWRMFFMACAELFGYRNGTEWLVAHYRFVRR